MSTGNVELAKEALGAMNRRDLDWLIAHTDPGIEMHMTGVAGEPVKYVGASGIRDYFRDMAEIWKSIEFNADDIQEFGDRTFVALKHRLRGRRSGIDVEDTAACVFTLRDGLVIEMRSYPDVAAALAAARLDP